LVTHAHIMLVGLVISFIYGTCHKLWLNDNDSGLAKIQFYLHHVGTLVMTTSLFLMYGGFVEASTLEPFLAASSVTVLVGMVLMKVMFIKSK
jgi:hypothetical protein